MMTYQMISATLGLLVAGTIIYLIRRDHLQPRYALWWILVACSVALFGMVPKIIDKVGATLGISYPPILLVIVGIVAILIKMLKMDIDRSQREAKLRRLIQRLAILEGEVYREDQEHSDQKK